MKLLRVLLIASLLPALMFAQRGGGARGGGGGGGFRGGGSAGGGIRSGGGGFSAGRVGGGFNGGGFRGGVGVGGFRGGYGYGRYGYGYRGYYGGGLYLGFGYPYYGYGYGYPYYGYGYGYPYDYGYSSYDPYYDSAPYGYGSVTYAQPQQPVVVQQSIQPPPNTSTATNGSFYRTPDFYLIAFNDHTIRAAVSYNIEGDQIHWVDREHEEHRAPLTSVDRSFSAQVNRDRRVEFRLP